MSKDRHTYLYSKQPMLVAIHEHAILHDPTAHDKKAGSHETNLDSTNLDY